MLQEDSSFNVLHFNQQMGVMRGQVRAPHAVTTSILVYSVIQVDLNHECKKVLPLPVAAVFRVLAC